MRTTLFIILFLLTLSTALAIDMPPSPTPPGGDNNENNGNNELPTPPPTPGTPEFSFARYAREQLSIKKISLPVFTRIESGSTISIAVQVKNNDETAIKNGLTVTASIPSLGVKKKVGPSTLLAHRETTKTLSLTIPDSAKPGLYLARITLSTDRFHRTVYRFIDVE